MFKLIFLLIFCFLFSYAYPQNIKWLQGTWNGMTEIPGCAQTHFITKIIIDSVLGNIFSGTSTETISGDDRAKIVVAMSGMLIGSKLNVAWGEIILKNEPSNSHWCNCTFCSKTSSYIAIDGENIVLIFETHNCSSCCDGHSEYYRSLYTFDTITQKNIVKRIGTPEEEQTFKPYVDESTPLPKIAANKPLQQVYLRDTVRIHDTIRTVLHDTITSNNTEPYPPVPSVLIDRKNTVIETFHVINKDIKIELFDNADVDGDTVTVYDNNDIIAEREMLKREPIVRMVHADAQHRNHSFTMVALNLGSIPPNTALMRITAGKRHFEVTAKADLSENARVNVIYDGE